MEQLIYSQLSLIIGG